MSTEQANLRNKLDLMRNEYQALRRKLDSKCEALLIVTQELDQCRTERDQFKLMADQLRDRCQTLKQQLRGRTSSPLLSSDSSHYVALQCKLECDSLKQKLADAEEDIRLLRERLAKERLGTSDEAMSARYFSQREREDLVCQLESSHEQFAQLERDLKRVIDEKEELVTERDSFKSKYNRLNVELNYILRGDEHRILDIDALCMDNRYLRERLKQMEEEKTAAVAAASKYKYLLERRKFKGILKAPTASGDAVHSGTFGGTNGSIGAALLSHKKVEQLLYHLTGVNPAAAFATAALPTLNLTAAASSALVPWSSQASEDVRSLAFVLLDAINDKSLALTHQRKTNKILAARICDLEAKLKAMDLPGQCSITGVSSTGGYVALAGGAELPQDCLVSEGQLHSEGSAQSLWSCENQQNLTDTQASFTATACCADASTAQSSPAEAAAVYPVPPQIPTAPQGTPEGGSSGASLQRLSVPRTVSQGAFDC